MIVLIIKYHIILYMQVMREQCSNKSRDLALALEPGDLRIKLKVECHD